ncbi:hypothetical protein [Streptomyces sp. G45]|uniref:hypothetical protein n=1 Tax=Streptomyces sp. G45 TaxID=3406627 RepID=UPI003C160858
MSADSIDEHSVVTLMGIVFLGFVAVVGLTGYACVTLAQSRRAPGPWLPRP